MKTKKIIDRNDLFFIGTMLFAVLFVFSLIYSIRLYYQNQSIVKDYNTEIALKNAYIDSLNKKVNNIEELYKPTLQNAWYWINYFKIKNPKIVLKQIILETSLKSNIFVQTNNCFNINYVKGRKSTCIGKYKQYCRYSDYVQSIKDYKLLQDRWNVPDNMSDEYYCKLLIRVNFAEDKEYINKLVK